MGGGTETFPDLGSHCQNSDCWQLDFLPFQCDACRRVFYSEHRSYKSHAFPISDHNSRKVVVCDTCSMSIETTGSHEKATLQRHEKSDQCDPAKKTMKKPACPVRRCRSILTFSNTIFCKSCQAKVCLKHRFPADHSCKAGGATPSPGNNKFLAAFAARNGKDCGKHRQYSSSSQATAIALSGK